MFSSDVIIFVKVVLACLVMLLALANNDIARVLVALGHEGVP
jgi:hypothetical protein